MQKKLSEYERIKMDFLKAIERISLGLPENLKLQELKGQNKLKLNFTNVALEAGRSRTLIAMDSSKYSEIREIILRHENFRDKRESVTVVIQRLKDEKDKLNKKLSKCRDAQARDFYALSDALKDARRWRDAYRRLKEDRAEEKKISIISSKNSLERK